MKKSLWIATIGVAFYLAIAGVVIYSTQAQKPVENAVKGVQTQSEPLNADKIFALVNQERTKQGLQPLAIDTEISAVSQLKADDMVARNYFSHYDPITNKNTTWDNPVWQKKCTYTSENISKDWRTNEEVVSGWMGSKPHHDTILNARYSTSGIATNGSIVVQHFCQVK